MDADKDNRTQSESPCKPARFASFGSRLARATSSKAISLSPGPGSPGTLSDAASESSAGIGLDFTKCVAASPQKDFGAIVPMAPRLLRFASHESMSMLSVASEDLQDTEVLEELFQWPQALLYKLLGIGHRPNQQVWQQRTLTSAMKHRQAEMRELFLEAMAEGVLLSTAYSGVEAPLHAAWEIMKAVEGSGVAGDCHGRQARKGSWQGFRSYSGGDSDARCRAISLGFHRESSKWPVQLRPTHVFGTLEDAVEDGNLLFDLYSLTSQHGTSASQDEVGRSLDSNGPACKKQKKAAAEPDYELFGKFLSTFGKVHRYFKDQCKSKSGPTAYCYKHKGKCSLHMPADLKKTAGRTMHVAGPICVDWSARGKKKGLAGPSTIPFLVWLGELSTSGVDLGIHEGTLQTDLKALIAPLEMVQEPGQPWGFYGFNLDPKRFGCPCSRPRLYTLVYRKDKFQFTGSQDELDMFLGQDLLCSGRVFFNDASTAFEEASLNNTQEQSLRRHEAAERDESDACIGDLNQMPPFGRLQKFVPALVTHGCIASLKDGKVLAAEQHLDVQLLSKESHARGEGSGLSCAFKKHLAGNTMHALSIGPMLVYSRHV
ncbi:unnamed protein product [Symbiodinium natans]|uniref:Uncharacterized protein n=1 Tax=Symbiodinium natans TaxID=878477 RepID=A0A812K2C3_9DINO|nr:unnamed protein product [Symbiodinium natans]